MGEFDFDNAAVIQFDDLTIVETDQLNSYIYLPTGGVLIGNMPVALQVRFTPPQALVFGGSVNFSFT